MDNNELFIGSGGGGSRGGGGKGGGSRTPVEHPNTISSKSQLDVLFLLCEGEIEGAAVNGDLYQSVYIDDVPIKNADGSFNFQGVRLGFRPGTLTQNYIAGIPAAQTEISVNQQVKQSTGAVVRTINNPDINAVVVRMVCPALQKINQKNSDIEPTDLTYCIDVRVNNGGWVERVRDAIYGKATSPFERFWRIDLPPGIIFDVRVRRLTSDSQTSTINNDLYWTSYTTIIDGKFRYPNSALLRVTLPGEQFKSVPRISFKGRFRKVLIPNNYNPTTRTYNGVWNGGFIQGYTNNPAWLVFDILINNRFGLGERVSASMLNKWAFYAIAQYCDELVPSRIAGLGNQPRFVCNVAIKDATDAYSLLNNFASCFRGNFYWGGGTITPIQDRPRSSMKLFTKANVIEEVDENGNVTRPAFTYSYSAKTARHTAALVRYVNAANDYRNDVEYVEHPLGISKFGYNPVDITAFGCTSQDQAHRLGLWLLETEQTLIRTVTFRIGAIGAFILPGEVIEISDSLRSVQRFGGRIKSIEGQNQIILDAPIYGAAIGDTIKFSLPDGNISQHTVAFGTDLENHKVVFSPPVSPLPDVDSVWLYSKATLQPQTFTIVSIVDKLDSTPSCYEITAIQYNGSIYDAVDFGKPLQEPPIALLPPTVPNAPFNVRGVVSPVLREGNWSFDIQVSWFDPLYNGEPDPFTKSYEVQFKDANTQAWGGRKTTADPSITYSALPEGVYYCRVRSVDVLDRTSNWVTSIAFNLSRPLPPDPTGNVSKLLTVSGGVIISWADITVYPYGVRGYNLYIDEVLNQFVNAVTQASTEIILPPGTYTVVIKAVDPTGSESEGGLTVTLGEEFTPKNPSGLASFNVNDLGFFQLFWTDNTTHNKDFRFYRVYLDDEKLEETVNSFTQPFQIDTAQSHTILVAAVNAQGIESAGGITAQIGAGVGSVTVPTPSGAVTKVLGGDGGVILRWTDSATYKNFGGYRLYLDGQLIGETTVKAFPGILRSPGSYNVQIKAFTRSGLQSAGSLDVTLLPEDFTPPAPAYLLVQQTLEGTKQFYWALPNNPPPDLKAYRLRYTVGGSRDWDNSHFLKDLPIVHSSFETALFREGTYTIMLKLVDVNDNESADFVWSQVSLNDPVPDNVVEWWNYRDPAASFTGQTNFMSRTPWQGTKSNMAIAPNGDLIVVDPTQEAYYESTFEVTSDGHLKTQQDIEGNYAVFYERLVQGIIWTGDDNLVLWSAANDNDPLWQQYDLLVPMPVAVAVDKEEYKIRVVVKPSATPGVIKQFSVIVDAPDIVETFEDVTISNLGTRITPSKPMSYLKSVNLTLQSPSGGSSAVTLKVLEKDPVSGALVEAYNSAGVRVSALVDAILSGY